MAGLFLRVLLVLRKRERSDSEEILRAKADDVLIAGIIILAGKGIVGPQARGNACSCAYAMSRRTSGTTQNFLLTQALAPISDLFLLILLYFLLILRVLLVLRKLERSDSKENSACESR